MSKTGKIIAVVGAPSIGKSTVVHNLDKHYDVKAFFEGEQSYWPEFIKDNIANNRNRLQTTLYFHNQNIKQYVEALKLREKKYDVVLDTFWLTNLFFVHDQIYDNKEEQELVRDLIEITNKSLPLPDFVVYLAGENVLIKKRALDRGRDFEKDIFKNFYKVNKAHSDFFEKADIKKELPGCKVIKLSAGRVDYNRLIKEIGLNKRATPKE